MNERTQVSTPQELLSKLDYAPTYPELRVIAKNLERIVGQWDSIADRIPLLRTKIALVGNHTLSFFQGPLSVFLAGRGIAADCVVGEFDNYRQELIDPESKIYKFKPQAVLVLLDHRAVHLWPAAGDTRENVHNLAMKQVGEWESLWENIHKASNAAIIQTNIALPCDRVLGNYEVKAPWSSSNYLQEINRILAERAPTYVGICDAEFLSGSLGKQTWFDEPFRYHSGQGFGFQALTAVACLMAGLIAGLLGKSKKCLVLDLDNTLWGGVVGDVGVEGLALSRGNPIGEAFVDFQVYCRKLKERGVVLAVCSKNNQETAKEPFQTHPEMVLKLDDFGAFVANWDDKATNLRKIAADLNLGLDSFVFVDDNPAERALVRKFLPEVAVPELPEDPALYRRALDQKNYFEMWSMSNEDFARSKYYASDLKRKELASKQTDLSDFLKSLQQVCTVGPVDDINLQRVVQLINKTNQWNITTERMTEGDVRVRMMDPAYFSIWVRHSDAFGDNGLICTLMTHQVNDVISIENWLMSCRVIKRGVEDFVFQELISEARRRGVKVIKGFYRPTEKNAMVANFYKDLGFDCTSTDENGQTWWELVLSKNLTVRPFFIKREEHQNNQIKNEKENGNDEGGAVSRAVNKSVSRGV